ncbi:MAG: hypothetical protein ACR2QT_06400 [Woeseiaceae bacterium]
MKTINSSLLPALLLLAIGCTESAPPPAYSVTAIGSPTENSATSPRLAGSSDGRLLLSWLEPDEDDVALRYSRYDAGGWTKPADVARSSDMFVNWADLPSVVPLGGDRLAAHWLVMTGAHAHAYDIAFTESTDNGETWSGVISPHNDGTDTEHGFVSIFPSDGGTGLIWLDGRKMVNEVTDDPVASGMTLRSNSDLIDELVCDCCQTDVAIASSGPIAVYRDRSVDEIRDIYVTRQIDGRWQPGSAVANDGWEIWGCPVNGPSIAADEHRVAVAWFTAADEPLVNVAVSTDSGVSFAAPIEIVRSETLGRAGVAWLDNGDVAVSWLQSDDPASSAIKVRRVFANGSLGPVRLVANTASGLSVPQMQRHGDELVFAWTEVRDDGARVTSARVNVAAL